MAAAILTKAIPSLFKSGPKPAAVRMSRVCLAYASRHPEGGSGSEYDKTKDYNPHDGDDDAKVKMEEAKKKTEELKEKAKVHAEAMKEKHGDAAVLAWALADEMNKMTKEMADKAQETKEKTKRVAETAKETVVGKSEEAIKEGKKKVVDECEAAVGQG